MKSRKMMVSISLLFIVFTAYGWNNNTGKIANHLFAIRSTRNPDIVVDFFSNLNEVIEKLGEPEAWNDTPTDFTRIGVKEVVFDGLRLVYRPRDDNFYRISYIRISNNNFETIGGVRVGMERDAVIALYGSPVEGWDELLSDFEREHGTSTMRYISEVPYAPGGHYLIELVMDEDDRVGHIVFTIMIDV